MMSGRILVLAAASLFAIGCGGGNYSVYGTVKLKNGTPVTKGTVTFDSGKYSASGEIKPDGSYKLTGEKSGAPPGSYTVYFLGTDAGDYTNPQPVINPKYNSATTSDLKTEVTASSNKIDFELDPP